MTVISDCWVFQFPAARCLDTIRNKTPRVVLLTVLFKSAVFIFAAFSKNESCLTYYTSDSLWKIWLVESIQSIHNSLWAWHDKCNICCRYCIYHVKITNFLVTKPLRVFSSEKKWLNASLLFLRMNSVKNVY